MNEHITACFSPDSSLWNCEGVERRAVHPRITDASSPGSAVTSLPDEIWLLVLAWCGLRTSATAAACSTAFKSLHRTVASTPELLARALLEDHGLNGAAASLYGSPAGHPHERHAVHSDAGLATTLRTLVGLSAPPGVAASVAASAAASAAAVATAAVSAISSEEADVSEGASTGDGNGNGNGMAQTLKVATAPQGMAPIAWASGGAPAFRQLAGGLLCAAAAAGHVQVAATALALGAAADRERALVAAAAAGRRGTVRLLLAAGADPNVVEPFGPCALHEAARHGYTDIVELLLDAGARVDGVTAVATTTVRQLAMPYHGRPASVLPLGDRQRTVAPPPAYPWRLWPSLGDAGTPRYPPPLRVPVPLGADSPASPTSPAPSSARASAPAPLGKAPDVQAFFSESVFGAGAPGTSHVRQKDEQPRTPAASASARSGGWDDDDDDDDDGAAASGAPGPRTPAARPLPLAPPPLLQRKPQLTLPPHGGLAPLPLMPSLTSVPPLPPPMMLMLQGGFPPRDGPSPLLAACRAGHAATAALLLRRGAKADKDGGAELVAAAHPDVVDELLSAVPGLVVHLGAALLAAASANRLEVVSALLRHGADPAFRGGMALTEVAFKGHVAVLEVLLKAGGARLRESGALGAALDLARTWGRTEVLQLLAAATQAGP